MYTLTIGVNMGDVVICDNKTESQMIRTYYLNAVHFPTLKTVIAIEDILKKSDMPVTRAEIKRRLKVKIMHQTLNLVLAYLLERGMIVNTNEGFVWIYNPNNKHLKNFMKRTVRVK